MTDTCTITISPAFTHCDIFSEIQAARFRVPYDSAIIWATGPNVLTALDTYPPDCYHMGVNGAVDLPVHLHSRVVLDSHAPRCAWFDTRRVGMLELHSNAIGSPFADMQFATHCGTPYLKWRSISGECTVSGAALALLYWCYKYHGQPGTVYLAGVDMGGGQYFNGYATQTPGAWGQIPHMQALLAECARGGLTVQTLTDTLLEVEHA